MYIVIDESANLVVKVVDDVDAAMRLAAAYEASTISGTYGVTREPARVGVYRRVWPVINIPSP